MSADSRFGCDIAERQTAMFAMFVGDGLFTSRAALSRASGIPTSTLKSYAAGAAMPFHTVLALAKFLPREAINMLSEPAGMRLVDVQQTDACWDEAAALTAGLVAEICVARSDGVINHIERASLRARARTVTAVLSDLTEED